MAKIKAFAPSLYIKCPAIRPSKVRTEKVDPKRVVFGEADPSSTSGGAGQ